MITAVTLSLLSTTPHSVTRVLPSVSVMQPTTLPALVVASLSLQMLCLPFTRCLPLPSENVDVSSSSSVVSSESFTVIQTKKEENGKCLAKLTIVGPGIKEEDNITCDEIPQTTITVNGILVVVGGSSYISEGKGTLVLVRDGECYQKVYHEDVDGHFTSERSTMSREDCVKVKEKIKVLMEDQKMNQQEIQQQIENIQANIDSIFGSIFGK